MKIAIGIMLWNEEGTIAATIDSVFAQTLFNTYRSQIDLVELVVLANGCTDQSIPNAQRSIEKHLADNSLNYVSAKVVELPKGRQPAWNTFAHEMYDDSLTYFFFMDADIILPDKDAMMRMVDGLEQNPHQYIATGLGCKHIELRQNRSPWQRLTMAMTKLEHDARFFYVTGGLYCGRSTFIKNMEFPKGFVCGDDGFLGYMAITNYLTTDYEWDRIHYPPHPIFIYEAYLSPFKLFRQHRRRLIGAVTREMIFDVIKSKQVDQRPDAGMILKTLNKENPEWLNEYIALQVKNRGFMVVPMQRVLYRYRQLRGLPLHKKVFRFPLAFLGGLWEFGVTIAANRMFHAGTYKNAWENLPNTQDLSG